MEKIENVIQSIKKLVKNEGYIYAFCMILFEDFHFNVERLHEINNYERLSIQEASFLLGFIIKSKINLSLPKSPRELLNMKIATYELMNKMHETFLNRCIEKIEDDIGEKTKKEFKIAEKEFWGTGEMLVEPMFYSGTGVYDIQYLEYLERKYKYDKEWLLKNKGFDVADTKKIVSRTRDILHEKAGKVHLLHLKEDYKIRNKIIKRINNKMPQQDREKVIAEFLTIIELYQYAELFVDKDTMETSFVNFCANILELFMVRKSDYGGVDVESFFNNFTLQIEDSTNAQFNNIGDYNQIDSHPLIKIDNDKYFVPILFLLYKAVYESPFYWMINDEKYIDRLAENRGKVGEEIVYDYLIEVFGKERIFKDVKISLKKGKDYTDVDILCILGSKALCVQIKSKPLTLLSRKGDDKQLAKDFKGAVQDAYDQALLSRNKILEKTLEYVDSNGKEINLSEAIDDVFLMCITTENYPSLTHQANVLLNKAKQDPYPLVLSVFDLELLVYYLSDPYEFLYYIRQRTSLMEYFKGDEEITFLGYHLKQKLWKIPEHDYTMIDNSYAQLIDRNYYPRKAGIAVADEGDSLTSTWRNDKYDELCNELKMSAQPKITDALFDIYDMSSQARDNLVNFMSQTKRQTLLDGKAHNFSMPPGDYERRIGFTYFSLNSNNIDELRKRVSLLSILRKYKSKGDSWIAFGSLIDSERIIDAMVYIDKPWSYDESLENNSKLFLEGKGQGRFVRLAKTGRNDPCPCGSGIKFKKCCGK